MNNWKLEIRCQIILAIPTIPATGPKITYSKTKCHFCIWHLGMFSLFISLFEANAVAITIVWHIKANVLTGFLFWVYIFMVKGTYFKLLRIKASAK